MDNEALKTNENLIVKTNATEELRKIEQIYNVSKIDEILNRLEMQKTKIEEEIIQYADRNKEPTRYNRKGEVVEYGVALKPIVIQNYFFKPITPLNNAMPIYTAEKLGLVYEYYNFVVACVNDRIGNYPSSLTLFCKMAGITLNELRSYKNSPDLSMRTIVEKIYDEIGDINLTMGQLDITRERSTIFRLKSENELVEKAQPKVNINIIEAPDKDALMEKINKYKHFVDKRSIK